LLRCYLQEPDKISNGFKRFNRGFIVGAIFFAGMTIVAAKLAPRSLWQTLSGAHARQAA
jgi:hypothetical protein